MAKVILGCDSNSNDEATLSTVYNGLTKAGYDVHQLDIAPGPFSAYAYSSDAKGKTGIYLMADSLFSFADGTQDLFDLDIFVIRGGVGGGINSQNDFDTKPLSRDPDCNSACDGWEGLTYPQMNSKAKGKCVAVYGGTTPEEALQAALDALSGKVSKSGSSDDGDDDDEEEWDDKDNFTPHKGKIMEIKPYKVISSISYDKSYDSPTGTGNVEILYATKDYPVLYKGVAMKLKLKRSSDDIEWTPTGLEEPDYDENEKFIKEHIPTPELLKELGLPDYRKIRKKATATPESDSSSSSSSSRNDSESGSGESSGESSGSGGGLSVPQPSARAIAGHRSPKLSSQSNDGNSFFRKLFFGRDF